MLTYHLAKKINMKHTDPFEYDEYEKEPLIDIDWQEVVLLILVALVFIGSLKSAGLL